MAGTLAQSATYIVRCVGGLACSEATSHSSTGDQLESSPKSFFISPILMLSYKVTEVKAFCCDVLVLTAAAVSLIRTSCVICFALRSTCSRLQGQYFPVAAVDASFCCFYLTLCNVQAWPPDCSSSSGWQVAHCSGLQGGGRVQIETLHFNIL